MTTIAIAQAEDLLTAAESTLTATRKRLAEHDDLITKTAAAIAALDADIEAALAKPDRGAAWRKTRSALSGEAEGLALQRAVLVKPVHAAEASVRAAERTLQAAREEELTRRVAEAETAMKPHIRAVVAAWRLHCERFVGHKLYDRARFCDWLFHPETGLFDLETLMNED